MRKYLIFLFIVIATFTKSQVVFCPPGAVWHVNYRTDAPFGPTPSLPDNIVLNYTGDAILDGETVKIIDHAFFYLSSCGNYHNNIGKTFIKQHGDTIFMRNGFTADTWQILYNFSTPAGGQWETTIRNPFDPTNLQTKTVTVSAVNTITINGISLKQLTTSVGLITERIGSANYLFYFPSSDCDGSNFKNFLCYQDNELGVYQPSEKPCDFAGTYVGIHEQENQSGISLYPNPASNKLSMELLNPVQTPELHITDILGKEVLTIKPLFTNSKTELDLSTLNKGIYFLKVFDNGKLIISKKIMKE